LALLDPMQGRSQTVTQARDRANHLRFLARSFQLVGNAGRALDPWREAVQVERSARLFATAGTRYKRYQIQRL
jgi:hypothetical protein